MFRLGATVHFIYSLYLLRLLHQSRAICMVKTLWETFPKESVCSPPGKSLSFFFFLKRKFCFSASSVTSVGSLFFPTFFISVKVACSLPGSKPLPGSLRLWFDLQCSMVVEAAPALHETSAAAAARVLSGSLRAQFEHPVVYIKHTHTHIDPHTHSPDIKCTCLLFDLFI